MQIEEAWAKLHTAACLAAARGSRLFHLDLATEAARSVFAQRGIIAALRSMAERAKAGDATQKTAPDFIPQSRLDETLAARRPVPAWRKAPIAAGATAWGRSTRTR